MTSVDAPARGPRAWRYALGLAVLVLLMFVLVGVVGSGPAPANVEPSSRAADASVTAADRTRQVGSEASAVAREASARDAEARARRDRARARILEALARRDAAPSPEPEEGRGGAEASGEDDDAARPSEARSGPASPGIQDRIGGRDALAAALNEDFLPLADECIAEAQARDPSLQGMLAIELDVIADAEIGAVVETVDFPDSGEVHDALLHECIRETTLSTILPPPPEGGREALMLTLKVEPTPPPE